MATASTSTQNLNHQLDGIANQMNNLSIEENTGRVPPNPPSSVQYDLDHDVVMRSNYHYNLTQIPEPGFFSGDTNETDLFCELCEATFTTYPNNELPDDAKVNFVKTRLRGSARNWYLSKYKNNIVPSNMGELLAGLRGAFNNVGSTKLAKIKLVTLRQNYGNINNYIEQFRTYSQPLGFDEEPLALLFYIGLHPKYQEEIQKLESFPTTLESIITKCILFENSLKTTMKIRESTSYKRNNNRKNNNHNNNYRNNNRHNNNGYKNNYKQRNNNYNNKNNNSNNENQIKAQKINSKN